MIHVLDEELVEILAEETKSENWYGDSPMAPAMELFGSLPSLRNRTELKEGVKLLVEYLEEKFSKKINEFENMKKKDVMSFEGLGYVFRKGEKAYGTYIIY